MFCLPTKACDLAVEILSVFGDHGRSATLVSSARRRRVRLHLLEKLTVVLFGLHGDVGVGDGPMVYVSFTPC